MHEVQGSAAPAAVVGEGARPMAGLGALVALCAIARFHRIAADPATLAHQLGCSPGEDVDTDLLLRAAKQLGLKAKLSRTTPDRLSLTPLPALALLRGEEGQTRCVILAQCDAQRVLLQDPSAASSRPVIEPLEVFAAQWTGELILITSRASLAGELAKFDFSWFIPSLVKYRRLLGEVLAISFMLQLFALVSPLFFQVVMDKVLVHRGLTTLDVLVIGLLVVVVFESLLNGLRSYVFSHTTSRIDVELGGRLFRHLVQLPLAYFQARRVGDSVARVRELENIRSFLTGNALTVLLDVLFSIVFIAVMLFYSVPLTLIVLVSLPLYFGLSLAVVPILRRRLDEKFARGAENQAMLVETVSAIQTVKATALEPAFGRRWDNQLAAYVSASFRTQNLASWAHEGVNLIGKAADTNDVYVYTNEFATFAGAARGTLTDSNGGRDTLNASAVTGNSVIDLNNGSTGTLAGKSLTVSGDIEIAFGGDGNDALTGNALNNVLLGGRGADVIHGGDGNDTLDGGKGVDLLTGGAGSDLFVINKEIGTQDTVVDLGAGASGSVVESIALIGFGGLSFATLSRTQVGADVRLDLGGGQTVLLRNHHPRSKLDRHQSDPILQGRLRHR